VDIVPVVNGKPDWDGSHPIWAQVGQLGEESGLEWAGRWTGHLREMAHFQFTEGLTIADLKSGKKIS
jgi:peptidoglycan L-alanyl-D-glutamate endopeptidase CwlK